jgi:hypothetical protein
MAHCHRGLGECGRRAGDRARAEEHLESARRLYQAMSAALWLTEVEAELAEKA